MKVNKENLSKMANALRFLSVDAVQNANSGHPGMPLGMADVTAVLFNHFLKYDPKDPTWINRDRFILSVGHGCMLQYSALHLCGYDKMTLEDIKNFRQINSICSGHPEIDHEAGVETSTGPLGHGLSMAVGVALGGKHLNADHPTIINNKVYVVVGDGCLQEGISYESIALAGHLNLNNLIVIWDNNSITIDGPVNIASSEDQIARFKANGFLTIEIDGHNYEEIYEAFEKAQSADKPVFIAAKTKIAFGAPTKEGTSKAHGSPLGEEEIKGLRKNLNWDYPLFVIPEDIKELWSKAHSHNNDYKDKWAELFDKYEHKEKIKDFFAKKYNLSNLNAKLNDFANDVINNKPNVATRVASKDILTILNKNIPNILGGTADLAASVMTKPDGAKDITKNNYGGDYINFGIREHAMGGVMNGLCVFGGFISYGGAFLVFSDFLRPAIRLGAIQDLQSIFVFSHDSIGVGEDGPTHQPIETIPSLRLMPNLTVLRPCDTIETIEAWQIALKNQNHPTAILLSRQNLPTIRKDFDIENNKSNRGGYIIKEENSPDVTIMASGSEVSLALEVANTLAKDNIKTRVVSVPDLNRFKGNSNDYINGTLGQPKVTVVIEAAVISGYKDIVKGKYLEFGCNHFGKSGKANAVFEDFGLTCDNITNHIKKSI